MSYTQTYVGELVLETCCNCGTVFGMQRDFQERCLDLGPEKPFFCPNGHKQWYSEGRIGKLKKQLNNAQNQNEYLQERNNSLHDQLTKTKHSNRALKAAKTKMLNRVKNGVCPCCNRTFKDLQRHFKSRHPELFQEQQTT